jgi:hypothetical protein
MHQGADEPRQHPRGVDALFAPFGWQTSTVNSVLVATCSQCSRPATRSPVSSACTSSARARPATAAAVNGSSPAAARAVHAATVPVDIGVPNNSASNPAVRSTGRC